MKGWYGNSQKHALASKGVKTGQDLEGKFKLYESDEALPIISAHFEVEQIIYVPSTDTMQRVVSEEEMRARVDEVREVLSNLFGGYTSVEAFGGYYDDEEGLVKEPVVRIISYTTKEGFDDRSEELIQYLEQKRKDWGQLSMGYEVEGDMYYLGATRWNASGKVDEEFRKAWNKEKKEEDYVRKQIAKTLSFESDGVKRIKTPAGFEVSPQKFTHMVIKKFNGKEYELVKNTIIKNKKQAESQAEWYREAGYNAIIQEAPKIKSVKGNFGNKYNIYIRKKED